MEYSPGKNESGREWLQCPEVNVEVEMGPILWRLTEIALGLAENQGDSELSSKLVAYFTEHPVAPPGSVLSQPFNDEAARWASFAYGDEERTSFALMAMREHKKSQVSDPEALIAEIHQAMSIVDANLPNDLREELLTWLGKDVSARKAFLLDYKKDLEGVIGFFRPLKQTADLRKVELVATNPFDGRYSGKSLSFAGDVFVFSHLENRHNMIHEFMHAFVNPIVDKLEVVLLEEEKEKISRMGSRELVERQGYGDGYYSLLCEGIIRQYQDFLLEHQEVPPNKEGFLASLNSVTESQFMEWSKKPRNEKQLGPLEINTLNEFVGKASVYYETFVRDDIGAILRKILIEYQDERGRDANVCFEDFFIKSFPAVMAAVER